MHHLLADEYMGNRTGSYEYRSVRYRAAGDKLIEYGLNNEKTVTDIGAGWTELDYCLRRDYDWRGRYIPIDYGISEIDLNNWKPYRKTDFYVALEILEHLYDPERAIETMIKNCYGGIICSVPNPHTVDVFAIDDTHVSVVNKEMFENYGFTVEERTFYGGVYSGGKPDALFSYMKL